jgi:pyruvate/2-oxoglutarate dehydrogenase complex dihydrolipoamide dehydrogenase (E3) component
MARIVVRNALFFGRARVSTLTIPWCTYTDPEVAHVGLGEHEAQQRGIAIDTIHVPLADVGRAVVDGEELGFCKVHLRRGSDRLLGATLVAAHAGETISELTAIVGARRGLADLARVIHCYPTQAEVIKAVADRWNRTRLTPWLQRLARWLLALRR